MRITGGMWRSRRLKGPGRGSSIRPTPDAMRERAFSVVGDQILNARVLDLYAGTGAVGLEALSRGAGAVVFVDRHRAAAKLINANRAALCGDDDRTGLIVASANSAVARLARDEEAFQVCWADPPFESWREGMLALIAAFESGVIEADGLACLECPAQAEVAAALPAWMEIGRDLVGGASRVVILRKKRLGVEAGHRGIDG